MIKEYLSIGHRIEADFFPNINYRQRWAGISHRTVCQTKQKITDLHVWGSPFERMNDWVNEWMGARCAMQKKAVSQAAAGSEQLNYIQLLNPTSVCNRCDLMLMWNVVKIVSKYSCRVILVTCYDHPGPDLTQYYIHNTRK